MKGFDKDVYRAILRVRAAYAFDLGGFLMRVYAYMATIGTISMLTLAGQSFFLAGTVSSTIALATFFISPRVSKRVDERGQSVVVPKAAAIALAGLALMLATVAFGLPVWLCYPGAVLMGFVPSAQALTRARWTYLVRSGRLGENAPTLKTVFSYEGVVDDIAFMIGPAASIALAAALFPAAGMLAGGICFVVGTCVLTASRSTEPEPGWGVAEQEAGAPDARVAAEGGAAVSAAELVATEAAATDARTAAPAPRRRSLMASSSAVRVLFFLMFFLGAFYGVFDSATVSFAEDIHNPSAASFILMVAACVSIASGLVFGMIRLVVSQRVQLLAASILVGCAYGTMMFIDSIESLFVVSTVAALFYAPFIITVNAMCEQMVPGERLTEALTWLTSGSVCGMAFGPTLGGMVIDQLGTTASFDFGAVLAIMIPLLALICFPLLKQPHP